MKTKQRKSDKEIVEKISTLLEKVRPYIKMHGGDVQFSSYKDNTVELDIFGACTHCSLADMTYNGLIAGLLKEEIPEIKDIILNKSL